MVLYQFGFVYDEFLLILLQFIVAIFVGSLILYLFWKWKSSGKMNTLPLYLAWVLVAYFGALIFAIFSQILQNTYTETINQTEWGVITNYSITQCFFILASYYQFIFNFEMFPTNKQWVVKATGSITIGVMFLNIVIPRYIMGTELIGIQALKFLISFILVFISSMYYVVSAHRISRIISNKMILRRIYYINIMYILIIVAGIIFGIAWSVETSIDLTLYSFYHLSFLFLMIGAFFGILAVRKASDEERKELVKSRQSLRSTGDSLR